MTLPTNNGLRGTTSTVDRETRRELAKLTAGYFNSIAVAIFAVGALAPPITLVTSWAEIARPSLTALLSLGAILLSLVTHLVARYILRREF